jgi:hypothetical protein
VTDNNFVDHIAHALVGLADDVLESVLDAVADVAVDLDSLSHDDVVHLVETAVKAAAGAAGAAATKHYLAQRRVDLDAAVRQALTAT